MCNKKQRICNSNIRQHVKRQGRNQHQVYLWDLYAALDRRSAWKVPKEAAWVSREVRYSNIQHVQIHFAGPKYKDGLPASIGQAGHWLKLCQDRP